MDNILANILKFTENGTKTPNTPQFASKVLINPLNGIMCNSLAVMCFSKERPYQLNQLLYSINKYFDVYPDFVVVLYSPGAYEQLYDEVFAKYPGVTPVKETNFQADFIAQLHHLSAIVEHIMFCVDDLIFVSHFSPNVYASALNQDSSVFSMQLKLHCGIIYSHSGSKVCVPPKLTTSFVQQSGDSISPERRQAYLTFYLCQGSSEWRYPFDLCASIYRLADILTIVTLGTQPDSSYGVDCFANPNKLEYTGNKIFWEHAALKGQYYKCACSTRLLASVITVNKVQNTYNVPIYANSVGDVDKLNNLLHYSVVNDSEAAVLSAVSNKQDIMFDFDKYLNSINLSVHIGDIFFSAVNPLNRLPKTLLSVPQVSVVLPVYNGAAFLSQCLHSLINVDQGCCFEIVVLDDGSTDNSLSIAQEWSVTAASKGIRLNVVSNSHQGLIASLNTGLQHATSEFIARVDADDVCEPHRLARQLHYLQSNTHIHVLGTQALVFSGVSEPSSSGSSYLAHNMPTHPVLVQWEMLFRCAVIHPSVMFRKSVIQECGGYGATGVSVSLEDMNCIEDYWLWSRVLSRYPLSIACLPDALLHLRLHSTSKSKVEAIPSKRASLALQHHQINQLLASSSSQTTKIIEQSVVNALIVPAKHLDHENSVDDALLLLTHMYETFSQQIDKSDQTKGDISMINLKHLCTEDTLIIPRVSSALCDDQITAVKNVLRNSYIKQQVKVLSAAIKKFPGEKKYSTQLAQLEQSDSNFQDRNQRSISLLKELVSN